MPDEARRPDPGPGRPDRLQRHGVRRLRRRWAALGYALLGTITAPTWLHFLAGVFLFDVGFDFALLAAGRGEMLVERAQRTIVGRALNRWAIACLPVLVIVTTGDVQKLALAAVLAPIGADILLRRERLARMV